MDDGTHPQESNDADVFLGLTAAAASFTQAAVLVLPVPMEATVSYGRGTAAGPAAILRASAQVEFFDRDYGCEPAMVYGIHSLPALELPDQPERAVEVIADAVAAAVGTGKLVVGLGGEHTMSVGFGRGLARAEGGPLTVVQIDAHADLRDTYDGTPFSHACAARRLLESEGIEHVVQLGIRSLCSEEADFIRDNPDKVSVWFADDIHAGGWQEALAARLRGRRVFLTIDVDGMDPSIMPATGTPEPDGLTWREMMEILRLVTVNSEVAGMDCVELAPAPNLHHADFTVAKLLYKAISLITFPRDRTPVPPAGGP